MRSLYAIFIIFVWLSHSNVVWAHAEKGKPRFVANSGQDTGNCDNRFRPCQTIAYAAEQAQKGDRILVAQGRYSTGLEFLISELVPVYGGYNPLDNFQQQSPNQHPTFLTGVPAEYAAKLSLKGFNVIRDNKKTTSSALAKSLASLAQLNQKQAEQACIDGQAGQFACHNLSLVSHLPLTAFEGSHNAANDIWGHVDLNTGKEYAIIGLRRGTAVVDISVPETPTVIGVIPGQSSTWRDIKVFQFYQESNKTWRAYAYVTTDSVNNEGVAIIDLNRLAQNQIDLVIKQQIHNGAHNVYISGVDYGLNIPLPGQTPVVHITGADVNGGAIRSYNLDDPELLSLEFDAAGSSRSDYSHDATSLMIDDSRTSQCPNSTEQGCLVIVDYNEQEVHFWDQSRIDQRTRLSTATYAQSAYVHSGWWSEDKRYVFVHDEGDEQSFNVNTTVQIFDISDLTAPRHVTAWRGPTAAIDHNGFVRGNRYYMANYTRGLTVLDISNPEQPVEAGFFDTFPSSDNASFNGAWGTYPFLPSGLILISDTSSGLYILSDQTTQGDINQVGMENKVFTGTEGQSIEVNVTRQGRTSEPAQVSYQTLPGSASLQDFNAVTGTLTWSADDESVRTVIIDVPADQDDNEFQEQFFVRLFDPKNGTTLTANNLATIIISGRENNGVVAFGDTQITLLENQSGRDISVNRNGGASGDLRISYELLDGTGTVADDVESASGELFWGDGDSAPKTITLRPIDDQQTEGDETLTLRLFTSDNTIIGTPDSLLVIIRDDESNSAPTADAGADAEYNVRQSVTLSGTAQDTQDSELRFQWQQESGTAVTISGDDLRSATFVAPSTPGTLEFTFTVTDEFGAESQDTIIVTIVAAAPPPSNVSSGGSGGSVNWVGLLLLLGYLLARQKRVSY